MKTKTKQLSTTRPNIKRQIGNQYEDQASQFLTAAGLKLITQNYQCRFGEIDLIMQDGDTLVFVEVRYRSNKDFGGPLASVTTSKQNRILKTAKHYLSQKPFEVYCRFDIIAFESAGEPIWLKNAFQE
ncbi:YraN family protein [Motilimonas eburnea]|uniref:YraN family protein n=1 Tax=Motilimonas eburnea TaxID=1737488 RepID=UPI001E54E946|nr:YraN family protein [Motilimonas eburnea]